MKKFLISVTAGVLALTATAAYAVSYNYKVLKALSTTTDGTVTVTTGSTFYQALAQNTARRQCYIINQTGHTMYVFLGSGTATTAKSTSVATGSNYTCATAGVGITTDAIQVTTGTSADILGVIEQQ